MRGGGVKLPLLFPQENSKVVRRIIIGLFFSVIGDAFLVYFEYFIFGMFAFALAQAVYTTAFGWERTKPLIGAALYLLAIAFVTIIVPGIDDIVIKVRPSVYVLVRGIHEWRLRNFSLFSAQLALPVYGALLVTMSWRALARAHSPLTLVTGLGTLLFVVSDAFIAVHQFYTPLEDFQLIVMTTYFAAQFAITLTTTEIFREETQKWKLEQSRKH